MPRQTLLAPNSAETHHSTHAVVEHHVVRQLQVPRLFVWRPQSVVAYARVQLWWEPPQHTLHERIPELRIQSTTTNIDVDGHALSYGPPVKLSTIASTATASCHSAHGSTNMAEYADRGICPSTSGHLSDTDLASCTCPDARVRGINRLGSHPDECYQRIVFSKKADR